MISFNLNSRAARSSTTYAQVIVQVITIILPVVLYGCETWSLTLREERRLRVFENSRRAAAGSSPAEIVGSNPTGGMDICLL